MPKRNTWVIKLGGSLIGSPDLVACLDAIAKISRSTRVIIVPGGGVFADVVRRAQTTLKLDDTVAHQMALQGMRQFGVALEGLTKSKFSAALSCTAEIKASTVRGGVSIWDPCDPALGSSSLPRDWRVTSDSLSLWLCGEFPNSRLLLVKSITPPASAVNTLSLAATNFVDDYFPVLRSSVTGPGWWLQRSYSHVLPALVAGYPEQAQYIGEV